MKIATIKVRPGKAEGVIALLTITARIVGNGWGTKMFRSAWVCAILLLVVTPAYSQTVDVEKLADAIKSQENSFNHPYGILKSYCRPGDPDGQCRKGCVQTINKRLKMWKEEGKPRDFISYLQKSYSPIGAKNDPDNLNIHWQKGVRFFYERSR